MYTSKIKSITAFAALTFFTASTSAQEPTSSSSFNWDSLISAADTATTTFDLYTTDGELGPGVLDTSSRYGLYTSATPIVGPIGNGTVANGTYPGSNGTTTTGIGSAGPTTGVVGGGSEGTGTTSGGSSGGSSASDSAGAPEQTGGAASVGGLWVEGAGVLVGIGALMAVM